MWNGVRVLAQVARGRRKLYQYYTNVTWRTCEECLSWHGRIRPRPEAFPDPRDGCPRHLLPFPVRQLGDYRTKSKQMAEAVRRERERRSWFQQAEEIVDSDPEQALRLLRQAGRVDVYLPEVERLACRHRALLRDDPELRDRLCGVVLEAWHEKFALPRYERLPERMREEHEKSGARYIEALLGQ